jgi:hypothetical protein
VGRCRTRRAIEGSLVEMLLVLDERDPSWANSPGDGWVTSLHLMNADDCLLQSVVRCRLE